MSFNELKNELHNCHDNKIKEKLIRELMLIKYKEHVIKKQNKIKKSKKKNNNSNNSNKVPTNEIDDAEDVIDFDYIDDDNNIIEYGKDITNNNLMDRLNNDMEIKKIKTTKSKKDIVKPFVNTSCDIYATFGNEIGTDITNFRR
jgi:hypothetical protein